MANQMNQEFSTNFRNMTMVIWAVLVIQMVVAYNQMDYLSSLVLCISSVVFVPLVVLTEKQYPYLSRFFLIIILNLNAFTGAAKNTFVDYSDYFFIPLCIAPFIFYDLKKTALRESLSLLPLVLWVLTRYIHLNEFFPGWYPKTADIPTLMLNNFISSFFATFICVRIFVRSIESLQITANQLNKLATLGELSASIGHEIATPLSFIKAKAKQLHQNAAKSSAPEAKLVQDLQKIETMAERIRSIIDGVKTISRNAEADAHNTFDVQKLFDDTLILVASRIRERGTKLHVSLTPATIKGNQTELSQVFLNLINNALDAVDDLPEKWIRLEAKALSQDLLEISITDSGQGIPPQVLEKLMTPFFTTKPLGKGTGLGLSLSKGIVERHGGRLYLDKAASHTRFIVELPLWGG